MKFLIIITFIICIFLLLKKNKENFYNHNIEPKGFDSFDKYMYINLQDRNDRKEQITKELSRMNIPKNKIIRIDAVKNKYNGHIGCCKSHIKTLKLAKKLGLKSVVILEDDFVFTLDKNTIENKINYFLNKYTNFDIIQLTTVHNKLKDIQDSHIKKVNSATTSSGYIILNHFFDTLIKDLKEALQKMKKEMEEFDKKNGKKIKKTYTDYALDQHWNPLQKKSKWYIFDPYLGRQGGDAAKSSIMENIESFFNFKPMPNILKIKV